MSPDVASVILRALSLFAMLQAVGVAIFLASFGQLAANSIGPIQRVGQLSAIAALPLLLGYYAIEAARMADDWSGVFDTSLQSAVMRSAATTVLTARVTGVCILLFGVRRDIAARPAGVAIGALVVAASFALTGHTAVHRLRGLLAPLLVAHVLVVAFWLGALLPLYLVITREAAHRAASVIDAFSAYATWFVPGIAVVGGLMALALVPDLATFREPYGELLLGKVAGFTLLMGFAAVNKWRLGPAIRLGTDASAGMLKGTLAFEYALITAVLVATAIMTTFFSPER